PECRPEVAGARTGQGPKVVAQPDEMRHAEAIIVVERQPDGPDHRVGDDDREDDPRWDEQPEGQAGLGPPALRRPGRAATDPARTTNRLSRQERLPSDQPPFWAISLSLLVMSWIAWSGVFCPWSAA